MSPSQDCSRSRQRNRSNSRDNLGIEIGLAIGRKDKGTEQNLKTETEKLDPLQDLDLVPC